MVALSVNSIRTAVYKNLLLESEKFNSSVLYRNAKHTPTLVLSVSNILFGVKGILKTMHLQPSLYLRFADYNNQFFDFFFFFVVL